MVVKEQIKEVEPGDIFKMLDYYVTFTKNKQGPVNQLNKNSKEFIYYITSKFDYVKWKVILRINKTENE